MAALVCIDHATGCWTHTEYPQNVNASAPNSAIDLLAALVRINSVNPDLPRGGSEAAVIDAAEGWLREWGIPTQRLAVPGRGDQLLATVSATAANGPVRLFDSHVDTVAVDGMTIAPFGAEVRESKLWGRGACDTKGTGAAMLWALRGYAKQSDRPATAAVLLSLDEECGMTGIRRFVEHDLGQLGWDQKKLTAVVGEPTELRPVIAHNGYLRWDLTVRGVAGHSSVPSESVNAITAAARVVTALQSRYLDTLDAQHDLTGHAAGSINVIAGGSAGNIVPDACTLTLDRRVVPGEDPAAVLPAVAAVIEALDPPVRFDQAPGLAHPPLGTERNAGWAGQVKHTLAEQGHRGPAVGAPFCTHAGYLDAAGVPAVVLGPGSPHKAHTADEWVELAQIEAGVAVYGALMAGA